MTQRAPLRKTVALGERLRRINQLTLGVAVGIVRHVSKPIRRTDLVVSSSVC